MQQNNFRDRNLVHHICQRIEEIARSFDRSIRLMEVCGTHTHSIFHFGIRELLPANVELLSGPGCPVCVTPMGYMDTAIRLARTPGVILTTFGDLMRVPGEGGSLLQAKAEGARVQVIYSPLDSLQIAKDHPEDLVVFLGVGFETTTPLSALAIQQAKAEGIRNFVIGSAHKLVPPALRWLAQEELGLDGLLLPGHVSVILGMEPYRFLADEYGMPGVVAGFEPVEILQAILKILEQLQLGQASIENAYARVVRPEGNPRALELLQRYFEPAASEWRGLGVIPDSGLLLQHEWREYDLWKHDLIQCLPDPMTDGHEPGKSQMGHANLTALTRDAGGRVPCICGQILTGRKTPLDCPSFGKTCQPETPLGACMVSSEGTCAAYHRYQRRGGKHHG